MADRNEWSITCIINAFPDKYGNARLVGLRLGDRVGADQCKLIQPRTLIILLVESNTVLKMLRILQNYRVILWQQNETIASLLDNENNRIR